MRESDLAGLLMAGSVGVFFDVYPVHKAAKLDPIHALRFGVIERIEP